LLAAHVVGVDLQQDVRAALQVEAEHHVALRPLGPALHHALGHEVRHGEQAHDHGREHDRQRLPTREKQHGSTRLRVYFFIDAQDAALDVSSFTGSPLARTSAIMERAWRTRRPSAISISISVASSSTFLVTRPISPPDVTMVSPRRMFLSIS